MNWDLFFEIGNFAIGVVGVIGGIGGIIFWRAARKEKEAAAKEKEANAQTAKIEAMGKEADFAETMLQKFEKAILARMDQGEAVNKKELDRVEQNLGQQLSDLQVENRKQNETIAAQNETIGTMSELLTDIKEYLNGGFAAFEESKHKPKGRKR